MLHVQGVPKKSISEISGSEMHMENLDRFGPCQIILDHFYTLGFFGPFWTGFGILGIYWTNVDPLQHYGFSRPLWPIWAALDHYFG